MVAIAVVVQYKVVTTYRSVQYTGDSEQDCSTNAMGSYLETADHWLPLIEVPADHWLRWVRLLWFC